MVITTTGTHVWSFVTLIYRNGLQSHVGDRKTSELMISTQRLRTLGTVCSHLYILTGTTYNAFHYWGNGS